MLFFLLPFIWPFQSEFFPPFRLSSSHQFFFLVLLAAASLGYSTFHLPSPHQFIFFSVYLLPPLSVILLFTCPHYSGFFFHFFSPLTLGFPTFPFFPNFIFLPCNFPPLRYILPFPCCLRSVFFFLLSLSPFLCLLPPPTLLFFSLSLYWVFLPIWTLPLFYLTPPLGFYSHSFALLTWFSLFPYPLHFRCFLSFHWPAPPFMFFLASSVCLSLLSFFRLITYLFLCTLPPSSLPPLSLSLSHSHSFPFKISSLSNSKPLSKY